MKKLLLYISPFFLFLSCKKDSSYTYYREIGDYAKSFAMFNPGSYWIYERDSTLTDSMSVQHLLQNDEYRDVPPYTEKCEGWQGRLSSANDINSRPTILIGSIDSSLIYSWFNWSLNCKFNYTSLIAGKDAVTKHPSMVVMGTTYTDVYEVTHLATSQDTSFLRVTGFLESNIGLIRWDVYNLDSTVTTWSLIRKSVTLQE